MKRVKPSDRYPFVAIKSWATKELSTGEDMESISLNYNPDKIKTAAARLELETAAGSRFYLTQHMGEHG